MDVIINEKKRFKNFQGAFYATEVTFQKSFRPSGNEAVGKIYFSGNHKIYGYKVEVSVLLTGKEIMSTNNYAGSTSYLRIFQDHIYFHECTTKNKRLKKNSRTLVTFRWSTQIIGQFCFTKGNRVCRSLLVVFIASDSHGTALYIYQNSVLKRRYLQIASLWGSFRPNGVFLDCNFRKMALGWLKLQSCHACFRWIKKFSFEILSDAVGRLWVLSEIEAPHVRNRYHYFQEAQTGSRYLQRS